MFDSEDRRKHLCIKKQYPKLDIRFVFSNANAKLYKKAKSRYSDWCEKNDFLYAHRIIPQKWLTERKKRVQLGVLPFKKKRAI